MAGSISATTAALISAAVGAAGIGTGLYEANNASIDQSASTKANSDALLKSQQAAANQANASSLLAQQNQKLIAGVGADMDNNKPVVSTANPAVTGNILTANTNPVVAAPKSTTGTVTPTGTIGS